MTICHEDESLLRQCFESGQMSPAQAVAHGIKPAITVEDIDQALAGAAANDSKRYTFTATELEQYVQDRIARRTAEKMRQMAEWEALFALGVATDQPNEGRRVMAWMRYPADAQPVQETIGFKVENWVCYGMPTEPLTDAQRTEIREYAEGFEECPADHDELVDMGDHDLIRAAYQAMADYARGQM